MNMNQTTKSVIIEDIENKNLENDVNYWENPQLQPEWNSSNFCSTTVTGSPDAEFMINSVIYDIVFLIFFIFICS